LASIQTKVKRNMATKPKKRAGGRTGSKGQGLEYCVEQLKHYGFLIYETKDAFSRAQKIPPRYVRKNFPHDTLYGGEGRKEALIVSDVGESEIFLSNDDNGELVINIIIEAKFQDVSGSVDEKIPYIIEQFKISPIKNWVVVMDGKYWKETRGKRAFEYLKNKSALVSNNEQKMIVVDRKGFGDLVKQAWGTPR
jgi:hypothetical protein